MMFSKTYLRRVVKESEAHDAKAANYILKAEKEKEMARTIRATIPAELYAQTKDDLIKADAEKSEKQ